MKTRHIIVEILPRLFWIIEVVTLILFSTIILDKSILFMITGIAISISGIALLILSFEALIRAIFSKELITRGIYNKVRHPMYSSIYILLVGIGILFYDWKWFVILLAFVPIWYLIALSEERQMSDLYPKEYPAYKKATGMFWPKIIKGKL